MSAQGVPAAKDDEVFALTAKANRELKGSGTALGGPELQVLVLIDGFSSVAEIAGRVLGLSRADVDAALRKLLDAKLVVSAENMDAMGSGFSTVAVPAGFFSGLAANPEADGGASILKQYGYFVRIARKPAEGREIGEGRRPTILVVDDDQDLQKLIKTYFSMEGFVTRSAFKGAEIVIALRQPPIPDAIVLDVNLPDANGFDILARMRQHPVLKNIPVLMLTAETTRAAVLKGLQGGADGYVTKPFEQDHLIAAMKAVLGLAGPAPKKAEAKKS